MAAIGTNAMDLARRAVVELTSLRHYNGDHVVTVYTRGDFLDDSKQVLFSLGTRSIASSFFPPFIEIASVPLSLIPAFPEGEHLTTGPHCCLQRATCGWVMGGLC